MFVSIVLRDLIVQCFILSAAGFYLGPHSDGAHQQFTEEDLKKIYSKDGEGVYSKEYPSPPADVKDKMDLINYMSRYGYIDLCHPLEDCKATDNLTAEDINYFYRSGLEKFQTVWKLDKIGLVNVMKVHRCANSDDNLVRWRSSARKKRYSKIRQWQDPYLTYSIKNYPSLGGLAVQDVISIINQSFALWQSQAAVNFTLASADTQADIEIYWLTNSVLIDSSEFARAYFPPVGYLYFNDANTFSKQCCTPGTYHLLQVATHSIGHLLGLDHTHIPGNIMLPFYNGSLATVTLGFDDINGIQALYGTQFVVATTNALVTVPPLTTTTQFAITSFCTTLNMDTVTTDDQGNVLFFRGPLMALADSKGIIPGWPRFITDGYPQIKPPVDAALYLPFVYVNSYAADTMLTATIVDEGGLYLFKGSKYYFYQSGNFIGSGQISQKFKGVPSNIDAAFTRIDATIIFVLGDQYYLVPRSRNGGEPYQVGLGYPKPVISLYPELKAQALVAGILTGYYLANGLTAYNYLFTGQNYFRFQELQSTIDLPNANQPNYPRNTNSWWLNCAFTGTNDTGGNLEGTSRITTAITRIRRNDDGTYKIIADSSGPTVPGKLTSRAFRTRWSIGVNVLNVIVGIFSIRYHGN